MKKSDIKNGMHVITNNGDEYVILNDIYATVQTENNHTAHTIMALINGNGWMDFDGYTSDLRYNRNSDYDIQAVFVPQFYSATLKSVNDYKYDGYDSYYFKKLWERDIPKKMTKADIERKLGYEIEIVED